MIRVCTAALYHVRYHGACRNAPLYHGEGTVDGIESGFAKGSRPDFSRPRSGPARRCHLIPSAPQGRRPHHEAGVVTTTADAVRARPGAKAKNDRRLRPRGSGGVYPVRDDVWRVDVEARRDPETGRRRRSSKYVYGSREDAELALANLRVNASQQRRPVPRSKRRSMRTVFELYLGDAQAGKVQLAPKTLVTSRSAANTMCKQRLADGRLFADIRPERLTWEDVEDLYATMKSSGLGADWIRRCATVLNRTLDYAKKHKVVDANPCSDAARPRTVRTKPYSPSRKDVDRLMATVRAYEKDGVKDEELADALEVIKGTGMRKGEFLALWVGNIDLRKSEIHVAWAVEDGGPGVGIVRMPTKKADWRDVPMVGPVRQAIERQLDRRRQLRGDDPRDNEYVFPRNLDGTEPIRPDSFSDRLSEARGASKLTFLDLRHYVATKMLDGGVPYRVVADLLGNSEVTLRLHYDGRTNLGKREAMSVLENDGLEE